MAFILIGIPLVAAIYYLGVYRLKRWKGFVCLVCAAFTYIPWGASVFLIWEFDLTVRPVWSAVGVAISFLCFMRLQRIIEFVSLPVKKRSNMVYPSTMTPLKGSGWVRQ